VFLDSREGAKASVLVHVKPGFHLEAQNVVAIANLVASAVESLSPDAVSVVDMQGNLLSRQRRPSSDPSEAAENSLDYKHQVEKDLTSKAEATIEPLLGEGKFRLGVTVDCDFSTSEQTDEVYDPTRSVMATSQKTEDLSQGASQSGVPGTPSNLPRSQIRSQAAGAGGGGSSVSRRTENQAFQTSRTIREVKTPRGIIKKISAALLIDQEVEWQGKGNQRKRVLIPPSPEKLKAIHDVVAGVLGISTDRGDLLVVETLPFEQTRNAEDAAAMGAAKPAESGKFTVKDLMANKKLLIGGGVGLLFIILLLGFLLRRPKGAAQSVQLAEQAVIMPGRASDKVIGSASAAGGTGESKQVGGAAGESDQAGDATKELEDNIPMLQLPEMTNHTKILVDHLRKSIAKDPETAASVIRAWIEEV
jgi:flagellar M-ring protein FliF